MPASIAAYQPDKAATPAVRMAFPARHGPSWTVRTVSRGQEGVSGWCTRRQATGHYPFGLGSGGLSQAAQWLVDLGLKDFAVLSTGEHIPHPGVRRMGPGAGRAPQL